MSVQVSRVSTLCLRLIMPTLDNLKLHSSGLCGGVSRVSRV